MIFSFSTLIIRGLERNEISIQSVKKNFSAKWKFNFDTAAILNLLDLRSIMGWPGGMSTIRYTRSLFTRTFSDQFFFKFS